MARSPYVKWFLRTVALPAFLVTLTASQALGQTPATAVPGSGSAQLTFLGDTFAQVVQGREVWITTANGQRQKSGWQG